MAHFLMHAPDFTWLRQKKHYHLECEHKAWDVTSYHVKSLDTVLWDSKSTDSDIPRVQLKKKCTILTLSKYLEVFS